MRVTIRDCRWRRRGCADRSSGSRPQCARSGPPQAARNFTRSFEAHELSSAVCLIRGRQSAAVPSRQHFFGTAGPTLCFRPQCGQLCRGRPRSARRNHFAREGQRRSNAVQNAFDRSRRIVLRETDPLVAFVGQIKGTAQNRSDHTPRHVGAGAV